MSDAKDTGGSRDSEIKDKECAELKLTSFSPGAGCGCKISPGVLSEILKNNKIGAAENSNLLVGNSSSDDAAVYRMPDGSALISTVDFFLPVIDDPFDFGRIAAVNAISDVYAMGGTPFLALSLLGWPIKKIAPDVAGRVIEGARSICSEAGIQLAGGHSIDSAEPIFGLQVNGTVSVENLKQNSTGRPGDLLYLTKPIGVGILTTAEKRGILQRGHREAVLDSMLRLNRIGEEVGKLKEVHAMTDVTGFGLFGHLIEMAEASGLSAELFFDKIPLLPGLQYYLEEKSFPGGTDRNWKSYGSKVGNITESVRLLLSDPQTSGGLLIAVGENGKDRLQSVLEEAGLRLYAEPIGRLVEKSANGIVVNVL